MVLETQKWLNTTYGDDSRFERVMENGNTGWPTIYGLTRALQIELGIAATADNFGTGTETRFLQRWPNGIKEQEASDTATSNVYSIIQGALWCKGYSTGSHITQNFYGGTGTAIRNLKLDMGFGDGSTVDVEIMKALLSMKQFVLLSNYGGRQGVRAVQQQINAQYRHYTGVIPTDGVYGREMNKALIQVLQAIEGFSPNEATGTFGTGTKSRLKTLSSGNADNFPQWVWLGAVTLMCNGYGSVAGNSWTAIERRVPDFQESYRLPVTGKLDPTTWMSLLTSKGDPDRPSIACDTRFEITDDLLTKLKSDGYQIVGRYLSEPNQDEKSPSDYFKAIRPGELERITEGGMQFFPIFQEYSTEIKQFTVSNGERHAKEAQLAAKRLHIPPTVIYFAVDVDVLDYQVDMNVLPYFRSLASTLEAGYQVGIYASRNVCQRVIDAGYALSAFVSDMSTGFSGNLGYPIPNEWNYDQFTEIHRYGGNWDLDKVAYAKRIPAVSSLLSDVSQPTDLLTSGTVSTGPIGFETDVISLIWHLENRVKELQDQGRVAMRVVAESDAPSTVRESIGICIANYLSARYLSGGYRSEFQWTVSAQAFRKEDMELLRADARSAPILRLLDGYVNTDAKNPKDASGTRIDLAHMLVTFLGYRNDMVIPKEYTGWAGDLATAMKNLAYLVQLNPAKLKTNDAQLQAAELLVGFSDQEISSWSELSGYRLEGNITDSRGNVKTVKVQNEFGSADLWSDADAIAIDEKIPLGYSNDPHQLSSFLLTYYSDITASVVRLQTIPRSGGASGISTAASWFERVLKGTVGDSKARDLARSGARVLLSDTVPEVYTTPVAQALASRCFS